MYFHDSEYPFLVRIDTVADVNTDTDTDYDTDYGSQTFLSSNALIQEQRAPLIIGGQNIAITFLVTVI